MKSARFPTAIFRFGIFEFNAESGELHKNGLKVRLNQQCAKLLCVLLKSEGKLCAREELRRNLWPANTFVDFEHSLNKAVWGVRQALGDFVASPRYIETVATQGYRFLAIPQNSCHPSSRTGVTRKLESMAIIPPANVCGAEECTYFAGQVACRLINRLSGVQKLRVLAYSTVKHYNQAGKEPRTIGSELGVDSVLAGEILQRNGDLILNVELIDVLDGAHVWGTRLKEAWPQAAEHAEQIADEIAQRLHPTLAPRRRGIMSVAGREPRSRRATAIKIIGAPLLRSSIRTKTVLFG